MSFLCLVFGHDKSNLFELSVNNWWDGKVQIYYCKRHKHHYLETSEVGFEDKICYVKKISEELFIGIKNMILSTDNTEEAFYKTVLKIGELLAEHNEYTHLGLITPLSQLFQVSGEPVLYSSYKTTIRTSGGT